MLANITARGRARAWLVALVAFASCGYSWSQKAIHLSLQREGQATVYLDRETSTATIVDLGREGDGDKVLIRVPPTDGSGVSRSVPLIEYLAEHEKAKNLIFVCSHPHDDHMGGIRGLFRKPLETFFVNGQVDAPRFETITVIDDGVRDSLAKMYTDFERRTKTSKAIKFTQLKVTGKDGKPTNAFATLKHLQKGVVVETVPYARPTGANEHGRSIITLVTLRDGDKQLRILDTDDAETKAIESAVKSLKLQKVTEIDAFTVPHHGSREHDVAAIFELNPRLAIVAVNPDNRFGHPHATALSKLVAKLGLANILFTGSTEDTILDARGVERFAHSAAERDTFHEFVEPARKRVLVKKASKERTDELAMFAAIRERVFGDTPPDPLPSIFDPSRPPGDPSPPSTTPPPVAPKGGGGGGGVAHLMNQIDAAGSIQPVGFDSGEVPAKGLDSDSAAALRVYKTARTIPTDAYTDAFLHRFTTSHYQPVLDAAGNAKGGGRMAIERVPNGGMVFLDGGRVTIQGTYLDLRKAAIAACGAKICLKIPDKTYELPFSDYALFKEVWDKVMAGTDTFYLSINPRKDYLQSGGRGAGVPEGKMRFGTGVPSASDAHNEVVTSGGIDRSRIGHILWNADVAFKSASLGVDVFSGVRKEIFSGLLVGDTGLSQNAGADTKVEDRWCRMYWTSGTPRFDFGRPDGVVVVSGDAVLAKAEAMRLRNRELEPFPEGPWCSREKRVAAVLQRQTNSGKAPSELRQLRELALMQSFALWARRVDGSAVLLEGSLPIAAVPPVPSWTSGVRSEPKLQVQQEEVRAAGRDARVIHISMTDSSVLDRCVMPAWDALEREWIRAGIEKDKDGIWRVGPGQDAVVKRSIENLTESIAKCGAGAVLPSLVTTELDDSESGIGKVGLQLHLLSSQIHGGVLLGRARVDDGLRLLDDQLWTPDGKLLFSRLGEELHFWNYVSTGSGLKVSQHVVFSTASVVDSYASNGRLRVLLAVPDFASIRKETRLLPALQGGIAAELLEIRQADTGFATLQKVAAPCRSSASRASPCVEIGDGGADLIMGKLGGDGAPVSQALDIQRLSNGRWIVELDASRLADYLQAEWDADKTTNGHLRAASSFALWGFIEQTRRATSLASKSVSADSKDVVLLGQEGRDLVKVRAIRLAAEIAVQLKRYRLSPPTSDKAAVQMMEQLDYMSKLVEQLPLEVSAPMSGLLQAEVDGIANSSQIKDAMRKRLVALAVQAGSSAESKTALVRGILAIRDAEGKPSMVTNQE